MPLIEKFFQYKIIEYYGISKLKVFFQNNKLSLFYLFLIISLLVFFTRIIIDIDILTNNKDLYSIIENELDKLSVKKFTFLRSDQELLNIKKTILNNQKDKLEWLNIERQGMKYIINLEPKVKALPLEEEKYCHVISTKDALVTRIITSKGIEVKDVNDSVKKGEILISGDIKLNEEIKNQICAQGEVYGKTWYTINITIPKTYLSKIPQKKQRYNIELRFNNKKYSIFKPRLKTYISERQKIVSIFGLDLYLIKDTEVIEETKFYTSQELENKVKELVTDKMSQMLKGEHQILEQKVLKKQDNNSTIDIEIFIVAEELISQTKTFEPETKTE